MLVGVIATINLHVTKLFFDVSADPLKLRSTIDDITREREAICFVIDSQLKRRVDVPFFLIAANVNVVMIGPAICQTVNQPRISMEIKNHRLVGREEGIKIAVV